MDGTIRSTVTHSGTQEERQPGKTGENSAKSCARSITVKVVMKKQDKEWKQGHDCKANSNVPQAFYREAMSCSVSSGRKSPVEEKR